MTKEEQALSDLIKSILVPEDLPEKYRTKPEVPLWGHCYGAAIALYYLLGGKDAGYALYKSDVECDGCRHYWVVNKDGERIDPTEEQYEQLGRPAPYSSGRRTGFRIPHEARVIIKKIKNMQNSEVPDGYWDKLVSAIRKAPRLPDDPSTNDPDPQF